MNSDTEWDLISRCRSGHGAAFEPLVREHEGRALAIATGLLGDSDDAADAVQEAFVKAYRSLGRLREGSAFGPWFRSIVLNNCRDRLRSSAPRQRVDWQEAESGEEGRVVATGSSDIERAELVSTVHNALSRLSLEHREILVLKEMEGMSYAEIARETGISAGTVASRLHHARAALRRIVLDERSFREGGQP
ncbi:MAG: sigma-70 family RNA polymerase sigma factor [Gemmatimonadetes bacterium]|nr:sigma-70 family RNA polymerase sigma factor [Gemmatimonadota bacterium]